MKLPAITLSILLSLLVTEKLCAKPKSLMIDLKKELSTATFVGVVAVDGYDGNGNILFHPLTGQDTFRTAVTHYYATDGALAPTGNSDKWTGAWPFKNDTVLIVLDSMRRVAVFAKEVKGYYRFWSPYYTLSLAMFTYSSPAIGLSYPWSQKNSNGLNETCVDGCLLKKEDLPAYCKP